MNEKRKASIYVVISILRDLMKGKQIKVGNNIIAMDDEGQYRLCIAKRK